MRSLLVTPLILTLIYFGTMVDGMKNSRDGVGERCLFSKKEWLVSLKKEWTLMNVRDYFIVHADGMQSHNSRLQCLRSSFFGPACVYLCVGRTRLVGSSYLDRHYFLGSV